MNNIKSHAVTFYRKFSLKTLKMEWRWRIRANNGNIIGASTEGYINRQDCEYNSKSCAMSILEYFRGYNESKVK